jgi:hypothetical protein
MDPSTPRGERAADPQAWEAPRLEALDVGGSESGNPILPFEGTTHYGQEYGPS